MASLPIVNTIDKRVGISIAIVAMVLLVIILLVLKFEIADPPPENIPIEMAEPMDVTEIENVVIDAGSGGSGSPSENDPAPPQQKEQIITTPKPKDTQVASGQGNVSNSNQDNAPAGDNVENHFGDGGTDGAGGGNDGIFGSDDGDGGEGTGPGAGSGKRYVLKNVQLDLDYDKAVKFSFKVIVDSKGNVMSAQVIKGSTTTTDQVLINKVKAAIKKQVKYSKLDGAPAVTLRYNFTLTPR